MAKRKAWQRALGGLGEGIANASQYALRQQAVDRQNAELAKRQKAMDDQNYQETLLQAVASGAPPEQVVAMAKARGIALDPGLLESVRPTVRKRLGSALDKPIMDAKSPAEVPDDMAIATIARSLGALDPNQPPDFATAGMEPQSGALAGLAPEVVDYSQSAATKRRALESVPSQKVEAFNPTTMATETQFVSPYTSGPIQSGPTPQQAGQKAGIEKTTALGVSGDAEATQAGKVAAATENAQQSVINSPQNRQARINEAIAKKQGELKAELAQSGLSEQQQRAALQLSDDFYTQSKDYYDTAASLRKVAATAQQIRDARKIGKDSPASNIGMVFAYMKMLDPGSTVREGEQATAAQARGVPDAILNTYNRMVNGGKLTDAQVEDFARAAGGLYQSAKADHARRIQDFTARATDYGVPPKLVVRDIDPTLDTLGQSDALSKLRNRGGQQ